MNGFWGQEQKMEEECREIVGSVFGRSSNKGRRVTGVRSSGRIWCLCVWCAGVTVEIGQGWTVKKQGEEVKEKNGLVMMVCGKCGGKNGRVEERGVRISAEIVTGSAVYEGLAEHCRSMGWEELEVKSERVMDQKAVFGAVSGWEVGRVMLKSVEVGRQGSRKSVEVLDYVDGGLL